MQALPGDSQKHAENYQLPDIGRLKNELPRQRLLYQEGSLEQMKEAFADGVCFRAEIQQSIIDDDNIAVMALFASYWDLVPDMRRHMIRKGSEQLVETYLQRRSLGKQCSDLVKNRRFSADFLRRNAAYLNKDALAYCVSARKINLK